jgi:hypothetical protein
MQQRHVNVEADDQDLLILVGYAVVVAIRALLTTTTTKTPTTASLRQAGINVI